MVRHCERTLRESKKMAVIYETKEDFERDKLKDQVKDVSLHGERQASLGLASVIGGTIVDTINTKRTGGLRLASIALNVVGIVEIVKSMFTASKAHDLRLKHERMGPQVSVIPSDSEIPTMEPARCCNRKHTANIQPTTLIEQAQRPEEPLVRG